MNWQKFMDLLFGGLMGLFFWFIINLLALVWCLIFGAIAYGFTSQALMAALFITAISAVVSLPGFLAMDSSLAEPYLGAGGLAGIALTMIGSVVYFCLRVFLRLELPSPLSTSLVVGGIAAGLSVLFLGFGLIDYVSYKLSQRKTT